MKTYLILMSVVTAITLFVALAGCGNPERFAQTRKYTPDLDEMYEPTEVCEVVEVVEVINRCYKVVGAKGKKGPKYVEIDCGKVKLK